MSLEPVERVIPDQLLVATAHTTAVLDMLSNSPLDIPLDPDRPPENAEVLGLTRIFLAGVYGEGAAENVKGTDGAFVLRLIVDRIRKEFGDRNSGWYPKLGKNRTLADNVIGGGSMIYGGVDDPKPLEPAALRRFRDNWLGDGKGRPASPGGRVKVGLVDTKIALSSPLTGGWYARAEDTLTSADLTLRAGHATFVAGLILSVAPGATIEVRGILDNNGQADSWQAAKAIAELGLSEIDILNLSFGCLTGDGQPPLALATAIDLLDPKTVVVAAAGNYDMSDDKVVNIDGQDRELRKCASFPAAIETVIAVGSAKEGAGIAPYSPSGDWVDAYADGTDVSSTFLNDLGFDGFAIWKGTSFSAALVTGAIAARTRRGEVPAMKAWEEVKAGFKNHLPGIGLSNGRLVPTEQWWKAQQATGSP